jgi:hypothetical protein
VFNEVRRSSVRCQSGATYDPRQYRNYYLPVGLLDRKLKISRSFQVAGNPLVKRPKQPEAKAADTYVGLLS